MPRRAALRRQRRSGSGARAAGAAAARADRAAQRRPRRRRGCVPRHGGACRHAAAWACAGFIVEAQRRNDPVAARLFAEEAAKERRRSPGPAQAVLEFRCAAGDWEGALAMLEGHRKSGMLDATLPAPARRAAHRARACAEDERPRRRARAALEAAKLAPELVPAAALAGRAARRGRRTAQGRQDHRGGVEGQSASRSRRDLRACAPVGFGARPARPHAGAGAHGAGRTSRAALAVARAALDAREFATARAALAPLLRRADPARRDC